MTAKILLARFRFCLEILKLMKFPLQVPEQVTWHRRKCRLVVSGNDPV